MMSWSSVVFNVLVQKIKIVWCICRLKQRIKYLISCFRNQSSFIFTKISYQNQTKQKKNPLLFSISLFLSQEKLDHHTIRKSPLRCVLYTTTTIVVDDCYYYWSSYAGTVAITPLTCTSHFFRHKIKQLILMRDRISSLLPARLCQCTASALAHCTSARVRACVTNRYVSNILACKFDQAAWIGINTYEGSLPSFMRPGSARVGAHYCATAN